MGGGLMSALAPTLEAFFTERLINQRHASPNTVAAYRDAWRLLLRYAQDRTGRQPCQLDLADLDASFVAGFLDHLEAERSNSVRTRNARLAAIRSFFSYAALCHPEHAGLIARVLAIPTKRAEHTELAYLDQPEVQALLAAPDRDTWTGRRDHALMDVAVDTGLRVSELTGLRNSNVELGTGAHVYCTGKGRKHRCTPLRKETAAVLSVWMRERGGGPDDPVFPTRRGTGIGRGAVERLVAKHAASAARSCSSLSTKHITPHVLRHTCAMSLLAQGVDTAVIALWLGHERVETTQIYVHADMSIKERALARTAPPNTTPGRYRPVDSLLAFLNGL
jgi:site-specific recombinase XerD